MNFSENYYQYRKYLCYWWFSHIIFMISAYDFTRIKFHHFSFMGNYRNMQWRHLNDVYQSYCIQCIIKAFLSSLSKSNITRMKLYSLVFLTLKVFGFDDYDYTRSVFRRHASPRIVRVMSVSANFQIFTYNFHQVF